MQRIVAQPGSEPRKRFVSIVFSGCAHDLQSMMHERRGNPEVVIYKHLGKYDPVLW
jgi:hypothetical protein